MSENIKASEPEVTADPESSNKLAKFGRFVLGSAVGLSIVAAGAALGYEFAVVSTEHQSFGPIPDQAAKALYALGGGVIGTMGGILVGAGISK